MYGIWSAESRVWDLESGLWSLESGVWDLESGLWSLEFGVWDLESGLWSLESKIVGTLKMHILHVAFSIGLSL